MDRGQFPTSRDLSNVTRESKLVFIFAWNLVKSEDHLRSTELLPHLKSSNVVDDDQVKDVEAKGTPAERTIELLMAIYRNCSKRPEVFDAFCHVVTIKQQAILRKHMPGMKEGGTRHNITFGNIKEEDLELFYGNLRKQGNPFCPESLVSTFSSYNPYMTPQQQIAVVCGVILFDWVDFCRVIEPPFRNGEEYVEIMRKKAGSFGENASYVAQCLQQWMRENPYKNFMDAVYDALLNGLENREKAEELEMSLRRMSHTHSTQPVFEEAIRTDESRFDTPPTQPMQYSNKAQIEPSTQTDRTNKPNEAALDDGLERTSHMPHAQLQSSCEEPEPEQIEQATKPDLSPNRTKEFYLESGFESTNDQEEGETEAKNLIDRVNLAKLRADVTPFQRGGFSKVYSVCIKKRDYVLKEILVLQKDSNYRKTINKEMETFASLKGCENIVTFYGMKWDNNHFYLLLEKCQFSLQEAIEKKTSFVLRDVLVGMCRGLDFLHTSQIVHKDLKPANVLLSRARNGKFVAKLADFGTSVCLDDHTSVTFTQSGTDGWRPPETKRKRGGKERPSYDVYCLGLVCYYTATGGEHPFSFYQHDIWADEPNYEPNYDALKELAEKKRDELSDSLSRYESASLLHLVMKMLSFDHEKRPDMTRVKNHCFFWNWETTDQFFSDKIWSDVYRLENEDEPRAVDPKAEKPKPEDPSLLDDVVESDSSAKGETEPDPKTMEKMKETEDTVERRKEAKQRIQTLSDGGWAKGDWTKMLDDANLRGRTKDYDKSAFSGFITFMRNKVVHWDRDKTNCKQLPYKSKKEALEYFLNCYPDLLPKLYEVSVNKIPYYLCL